METLKDKIIELIDNSEYNEAAELAAKVLQFELKFEGVRFDSMPWDTDGQKRYIVSCNLVRGDKSYKFDFGTSLKNSCIEDSEWNLMNDCDLIEVYAGIGLRTRPVSGSVKFQKTKSEIENLPLSFIKEQSELMVKNYKDSADKFNKGKSVNHKDYTKNELSILEAERSIKNAINAKIESLKRNKMMSKSIALPHSKMPSIYDIITCLQKENPGDTFEDFCDWMGYDNDSRLAERTYKICLKEYNRLKQMFNEEELEALFYIQ